MFLRKKKKTTYTDVVVSAAEVGIGSMDLVSLFVHKREASTSMRVVSSAR